MNQIEKELKNHLCKTCGNLTYWDWYICKAGKHATKRDFLNMRPLKHCDGYIKRIGSNKESCKDQECVFWCNDCPAYQKDEIKTENQICNI